MFLQLYNRIKRFFGLPYQERLRNSWVWKLNGAYFSPTDSQPTRIGDFGHKEWYNKIGQLHRDNDLPALEWMNTVKEWYVNGKRHRDNGLHARTFADGTKLWYVNGNIHRDGGDLPAIIQPNGTKIWYKNGETHRGGDLPAIEYMNGTKAWYKNNKTHRDGDLPAIEYADGEKSWFKYGKQHRDGDLHAVEHADGSKEWYKYGTEYTHAEIVNFYQIFTRFGRHCLKKIRLARLKRSKEINNELMCMPSNSIYPGGQDYQKALAWFRVHV